MKPLPPELLAGPFTRERARSLGVTERVLEGTRFVRVHTSVYRHRDHPMTEQDRIEAARLALPESARLTGLTRIRQLGLDFGPSAPVRFVVEDDLHLVLDGVFLHRTKRMPPTEGGAVTPAAAFIAYCRRARVIDAIKVGDWLLHREHLTLGELHDLALAEQWRDGADEALWVLDHLDGDSRSLPESEIRALLEFAGLADPDVNQVLPIEGRTVIGDLVYLRWRTVVEYEGSHHQIDRGQYVADIGRYAVMRRAQLGYVQVTKEKLSHPRRLVMEVFAELASRGYDGPAPVFGHTWLTLFQRITDVLGPRQDRHRSRAVS